MLPTARMWALAWVALARVALAVFALLLIGLLTDIKLPFSSPIGLAWSVRRSPGAGGVMSAPDVSAAAHDIAIGPLLPTAIPKTSPK